MKKQKIPDLKRYAPPKNYYEQTSSRSPSKQLIEALRLPTRAPKSSLDFGCGAGSETKCLVEHGYNVTAVDGNKDAKEYIENIKGSGKAKFVLSGFEDFEFGSFGLINSSNSLSFIHKDYFGDVMKRLLSSILPDGLFVGNIFGINDQWNKPEETMTFLGKEEARRTFKEMKILTFEEFEGDGHIANDKPKYWHKFYITARK